MSGLENADDGRYGPGPWFVAEYGGNCSRCGEEFDEGDRIRADGFGSWECCDEDEPSATRFTGTSDEEMGF